MNVLTMKHLPRRTFLRGVGATLALPFLDAMVPALSRAAGVKTSATRMAFVYFPNGVQPGTWAPEAQGEVSPLTDALPRVLKPLAAHRNDILLLENLTVDGGRAHGDGPGDHGRAGASYLTGVHPKKTFKDIQAGVSVDQFAAQKIGGQTRFASLELGGEEGIQGGNCDNGYSCAYSNSISWRTPSTPNPPEVRPRAVFERLFGTAETEPDPRKRAKRDRYNKSVLDAVLLDARKLQGEVGADDKRKLDEYFYAVRDIESRVERAERENSQKLAPTLGVPPSSVPEHYTDHSRLMFDLMIAAFQTDATRIITFLMAIEQSNRNYREINIPDAHHGLTHHGGDKEKIEKCIRINEYQMEQFAYFVDKLKTTKDGDGTLFDHVMVTYGSGLSLNHNHDNLPTILTGKGGGRFHLGRQVKYATDTPLANLHVAMLDTMGIPAETFADSTGKLGYLANL